MAATNFVVRNDAGVVNRGVTGGNGLALPIGASAGSDISLNLTQQQIMSYGRVGTSLEITLTDGQIIVVDNYFSGNGTPQSDLFLSDNGLLTQVELAPGQGGVYYSTYVAEDSYGKFTAADDLYFYPGQDTIVAAPVGVVADDGVGMLGVLPFLGGLGLWPLAGIAAAAVIPAIAGGGDDDPTVLNNGEERPETPETPETPDAPITPETPTTPEVPPLTGTILTGTVEAGDVVNREDREDGVDITGTGTVGATIVVTIDGETQTTIINEDGNWNVVFGPDQITEGTYQVDVVVVVSNETGTLQIDDALRVDTEITVTFDEDSVGGDGTVNLDENSDVVTLSGTTDLGSSVVVTVDGVEYDAIVTETGWICGFPGGTFNPGEYVQNVSVTATDSVGNTATVTGDFVVDTVTTVTLDTNTFGGDSVLNFTERNGGVTLTGTAEVGATVIVTISGVAGTVTVSETGTWSATWSVTDLPGGLIESTAGVTVVSTDLAGNSATATGTIAIDTFVNTLTLTSVPVTGDDIINEAEWGSDIDLSGQVEAGSTVTVTISGVTRTATVTAEGEWSVTFEGGSLPVGEYDADILVNATDGAGNTASLTHGVRIDTVVGEVALSPEPIEIDDVVNAVEVSDGVLISGTATAGLTVTVTLGAASHQVVADGDGNWDSLFASSEVPGGTYTADITASITDSAGNFRSVSDTVGIDTELTVSIDGDVEGDNIISALEARDGVEFSGTTEPLSTVVVGYGSASRTVTADGSGVWIASFDAGDIPSGDMAQTVTAQATDRAGNTATAEHAFRVDTVVEPLTLRTVEGDNLVNRAEAADGIALSGTVERGATGIEITYEGTVYAGTIASNGTWSVLIPAGDVVAGDGDVVTVAITATDHVGNVRTIDGTFIVDTTPPEAPVIESYRVTGTGEVREFTTSLTDDDIEIHSLNGDGAPVDVTPDPTVDTVFNETSFRFDPSVAAGTHLVMTAADDAGNATSTLFVVDELGTNVVNVDRGNLDGFDVEAIDLQFAEDSSLTLSATQLESLSAHSNRLTIHGGADDTVNIAGATATGTTSEIGGRIFEHYTLGSDGGTLIIDDEINVIT